MKKFVSLITVLSLALFIFLIPNISEGATEVYTWGSNNNGQLGDGTDTDSNTPIHIPGFTGATAIAGGSLHTLVVKSDGTVWAWGG